MKTFIGLLTCCLFIISCQSKKIASSDLVFNKTSNEFGQLIYSETSMEDVKAIYGNRCKKNKNYRTCSLSGRFNGGFTYSEFTYSLVYSRLGLEFEFCRKPQCLGFTNQYLYEYPRFCCVYFLENYPDEVESVDIGKTTFAEVERLIASDTLEYSLTDVPRKKLKREHDTFQVIYYNEKVGYYSAPFSKVKYAKYKVLWEKGYDFNVEELKLLEELKKMPICKVEIRQQYD